MSKTEGRPTRRPLRRRGAGRETVGPSLQTNSDGPESTQELIRRLIENVAVPELVRRHNREGESSGGSEARPGVAAHGAPPVSALTHVPARAPGATLH